MLERYGYGFVNGVWLNKERRKAFSREVVEDCKDHPSPSLGMPWLMNKLGEAVPSAEFRFYANNPPTNVREIADKCGFSDLKAVVVYRIRGT
jgi:hypothetical protein